MMYYECNLFQKAIEELNKGFDLYVEFDFFLNAQEVGKSQCFTFPQC